MFNLEFLNNNFVVFILIVWETFWKLIGLWRSAKRGDTLWFVGIFIINLFGIIPLIYLWRTKQLEETINDTLRFLRLKKN